LYNQNPVRFGDATAVSLQPLFNDLPVHGEFQQTAISTQNLPVQQLIQVQW